MAENMPFIINVSKGQAQDDKKLSVASTTFFIVTGVLNVVPLPYALMESGLISGIVIMCVLGFAMVYMGIVLGRCWLILLERWPERYAGKATRRPYPAIAEEAGGKFWAYFVGASVNVTNVGTAVVDLLLTVSTVQLLLPGHLSDRVWLLIWTAASMPFVWLGRPMESWTVGWAGGLTGIIGTILLLVGVVVAGVASTPSTSAPTTTAFNSSVAAGGTLYADLSSTAVPAVTFKSFWLGISTLSFTFAGMSIFPSIQHDMAEPKRWPKAVVYSYLIIASLCLITAVMGLEFFGGDTKDNVIGNVSCQGSHPAKVIADIVSVIFIVQFLCNAIVSVLPVVQDFEEFLNDRIFLNHFPSDVTTWKHIISRTFLMVFCMGLAQAIPHFDQYMSLVGATSISLNNFFLPPLFYLMLHGKAVGFGERAFFYEMMTFAIIFAIAGTYSAITAIISSSSSSSQCGN